jgi:cell division control protein 6
MENSEASVLETPIKTDNVGDEIDNYFDEFLESELIFNDKDILSEEYIPKNISHRDSYLSEIAKILAPILKGQKASNLFIYGKVGAGKTICVNHILNKIENIVNSKNLPIKIVKINCKLKGVSDTEFRVIYEIIKQLGYVELNSNPNRKGESKNQIYNDFHKFLEQNEKRVIIVLDEIDHLIKRSGDEILYNLIRLNPELKKAKIQLIGITNDLVIMDGIDTRIRSSLGEEEIVFLPYTATQIQEILTNRAQLAFFPNILNEEVIPQTAAFAAKEHGDIRRAIDLLRYSAELAQRENSKTIELKHLLKADKKTEKNRIIDIIKSQPKQFQMITYSIIKTCQKTKLNLLTNKKQLIIEPTTTGSVYDYYNNLAKDLGQSNLSLRRVSDIIVELDILGIINFKIVSKGRYGRTRYISIGLPKTLFSEVIDILKTDLELD